MKKLLCLLLAAFLIGCGSKEYSYTNLVDETEWADFQPVEDYLSAYAASPYGQIHLDKGWQTARIGQDLYDYTKVLTVNVDLPKDLNCRQACFLMIRDRLGLDKGTSGEGDWPETENLREEIQALPLSEEEAILYQLLFSDLVEEESPADRYGRYGLNFPGEGKLLAAWEEGHCRHAGLVYQEGEEIWLLFEKIDPLLPFQLSKFESQEDLLAYWRQGRFRGQESVDIYLNEEKL